MKPFFWYDVMTTDVGAAAKFYSSVVGWTAADSGVPGMSYTVLSANGQGLAGIMAKPEGAPFPNMWTGYIFSDDVDADVKKAVKLGGKVCKEPEDIPQVGRFAVLADPHGAMFNIMKPNSDQKRPEPEKGEVGTIGWHELHAGDLATEWTFYEKMFGWQKLRPFDMGPMGIYQIWSMTEDNQDSGGMMTKMKDMPMSAWVFYFTVDGIDAAKARVEAGGGKVIMGPMQVPGGQWVLQGFDPQGAMFALVSLKK